MTKDEKLKITPEFDCALRLWGEDKPQEAINVFKKLNAEFPNQPALLGMIGGIYRTLDDFTNALTYFEKTVEFSPKSELASRALFLTLWELKRYENAFEEAQRFIKLRGITEEYAFIINEFEEQGFLDQTPFASCRIAPK